MNFIEIPNIDYNLIDINAKNKKSESVNTELRAKIKEIEIKNKLIIINVKGELSEGKTTDIDFSGIKDELVNKEAISVLSEQARKKRLEGKIEEARLREHGIDLLNQASKDRHAGYWIILATYN